MYILYGKDFLFALTFLLIFNIYIKTEKNEN